MANDLPESHSSLLLNYCVYGTLPPEADSEGNIEYKVLLNTTIKESETYAFTSSNWSIRQLNA